MGLTMIVNGWTEYSADQHRYTHGVRELTTIHLNVIFQVLGVPYLKTIGLSRSATRRPGSSSLLTKITAYTYTVIVHDDPRAAADFANNPHGLGGVVLEPALAHASAYKNGAPQPSPPTDTPHPLQQSCVYPFYTSHREYFLCTRLSTWRIIEKSRGTALTWSNSMKGTPGIP
jgi:hypothetical protein